MDARRRDEHHLEEPVRHDGVAVPRLQDLGGGGGCLRFTGVQERDLGGRRMVHEARRSDDAADDVAVHQVVADEEVGEAGDGVEADVLEADHRGVLGADGARLQHGEPGAHPHHERAPDEERERVEDERRLLLHAGGVGDGRADEEEDKGCQARCREDGGGAAACKYAHERRQRGTSSYRRIRDDATTRYGRGGGPHPSPLPRRERGLERRGTGALTLTPVSSTGQALALSHDGRGDWSGGGGGTVAKNGDGNVAWCCILLHFRLLLSCGRSPSPPYRVRGRL